MLEKRTPRAPNASHVVGGFAGVDNTLVASPCVETIVKEPSELTKAIRWISRYNGRYAELYELKKIVITEGWRNLSANQLADLIRFAKKPTKWTGKTMQFKEVDTEDNSFEELKTYREPTEGEYDDYNI